jgi:hypothetical protein
MDEHTDELLQQGLAGDHEALLAWEAKVWMEPTPYRRGGPDGSCEPDHDRGLTR